VVNYLQIGCFPADLRLLGYIAGHILTLFCVSAILAIGGFAV